MNTIKRYDPRENIVLETKYPCSAMPAKVQKVATARQSSLCPSPALLLLFTSGGEAFQPNSTNSAERPWHQQTWQQQAPEATLRPQLSHALPLQLDCPPLATKQATLSFLSRMKHGPGGREEREKERSFH